MWSNPPAIDLGDTVQPDFRPVFQTQELHAVPGDDIDDPGVTTLSPPGLVAIRQNTARATQCPQFELVMQ